MTSTACPTWPGVIDYQRAVAEPKNSFTHPDLQQCTPELDSFGLPLSISGACALTYKLHSGRNSLALRVFLQFNSGRSIRLPLIQRSIDAIGHPGLPPFDYDDKGIIINDVARPVMTMPWIDGVNLRDFVDQHINEPKAILALKDQFVDLLCELQRHGVAHGDLQHGNMLVTPSGQLVLIDYDGMYVPQLSGMASPVLGHKHYQHPMRTGHDFGPHMDRFSARLICDTLVILAADPLLWTTLGSGRESNGDDFLLWRSADLERPHESTRFDRLKDHRDAVIRRATERVLVLLRMPLRSIPALQEAMRTKHACP